MDLARARVARIGITVGVVAASLGACSGTHGHPRVSRAAPTTTLSASTTTLPGNASGPTGATGPTGSTGPRGATGPESGPSVPGRSGQEIVPPTKSAPTTTAALAGSPWPPGTLTGSQSHLTATIAFADSTVTQGTPLKWSVAISNPDDAWAFWGFLPYNYLGAYLYSAATDGMSVIKSDAVAGTVAEFQHQTQQGVMTGLLLAPHATYRYSGSYNGTVDHTATTDYVVHAAAILDPGYGQGLGAWPGPRAAITIIVPPKTETTI